MARPAAGAGAPVLILPPAAPGAVAFVDAQHGWVGGAGGLLGTVDGKAFRIETRRSITELSALDGRHAWALTEDGSLLRTRNGSRWGQIGRPKLLHVQFVDARHGYGLTRKEAVLQSSDGGFSWTRVPTPAAAQSECFASRRDGWVARAGSVWSTHDGGDHWTRARLRKPAQELAELACRTRDVWVVFHEGGAAGTEGYHVYASLDGGASWRARLASPFQRRLPSISNYTGPFDVLGNGVAIFTGACAPCEGFGTATIVRTVDGGASFRRTTPFHGYLPRAVSFVDARRGWLLTAGHAGSASAVKMGVLWRTVDGGRRWRVVLQSPSLS